MVVVLEVEVASVEPKNVAVSEVTIVTVAEIETVTVTEVDAVGSTTGGVEVGDVGEGVGDVVEVEDDVTTGAVLMQLQALDTREASLLQAEAKVGRGPGNRVVV